MRNNILLPFLVFLFVHINAQSDSSDIEHYLDFDRIMDKVFSQVPENAYQSDFNLSKTNYWVHPETYFGKGNNGDTLVGELLFKSLYYTMCQAQRKDSLLPTLDSLEERLERYVSLYGKVPLIVLDIEYDEIKPNIYAKGWVDFIDTMIVPLGNHPLFKPKEVFSTIPYWKDEYKDLPLTWEDDFVFTNKTNVNYNSFRLEIGKEKLKKEELGLVTLEQASYGSSFCQAKSTRYALSISASTNKSQIAGFPLPNDIIPLSGSYSYGGESWENELGLWQGCQYTDKRIRKPVLIVEGFDPFNERNFDITQKNIDDCHEDYHLYWASNDEGLADQLREQGYDVLILNFANGSGELHQNAMTVVEAINYINNHKVTNNELIVIGPSMGGLLARYALAYMEETNIEHYTKLFLSFDAPHKGANVCLGVQHALRFVVNSTWAVPNFIIPSITRLDTRLLNASATKQMLLYHHSQTGGLSANSHPMFQTFQQQMHNLNDPYGGYPVKCKKIAISNGSSAAIDQFGFNEGDNLFHFRGLLTNGFFDVDMSIKYNALPNNSFKNIFSGFSSIMFLSTFPVSMNIAIKSVKNTVPIDNAPAGTQVFHSKTFNNLIAHPVVANTDPCVVNPTTPSWGIVLNDDRNKDAFVPTISALDLQNTTDWRYNFMANHFGNQNNYGAYVFLDNVITPFNEVYVNTTNDPHVITSLDAISGAWATNEIGPHDMKLQNHTVTYDTDYEAVSTIEVGRNVTSELNSGDFNLSSGTYTDFLAANSIEFKPGFNTDGGTMLAHLDDINCTIIKSETLVEEQSNELSQPANSIVRMILDNDTPISIYPNPAKGMITLRSTNEKIKEVMAFNIQGKLLFAQKVNSNNLTLDASEWGKGVYIVKIITETGNHTDKVVME